MTYRGYKYRLYPDREQRAYFARCFGATRYIYNYCVRQYDAACAAGREPSGFDIMALAREHINTLAWMTDVDYEVKESAPRRFDKALSKFKRRQANRPREHKKGDRPTISYCTGGVIHVDFKHDLIQLPKIGIVKARLHRTFDGEITSATVKREADGNYYVSIVVNIDEQNVLLKPHTEQGTIGIDVGLRHLATLSNGDTIDLPDMERSLKRIEFLKKRQERQKPGSKRYYRTASQIARLHHHNANVTRDNHHKAAVKLCRNYDTICMETLNVEGMKKDTKTTGGIAFNSKLHRAALALFIDRVRQKCEDTGTHFVAIDRFEPTTKTCSHCGHVLPTIDLDTKEWTCPQCHTHHDRDHNAAINIRNKGLEQIAEKPLPKFYLPKHEPILPLAEGKVKTAKKATAGCNLRTVKGKARAGRPLKAQIADSPAPPRTFNRKPLPPDHLFRNFKLLPLSELAGLSSATVKKLIECSIFIDPAPEEVEPSIKLLKAIKQVAADLRQLRLTSDEPAHTKEMLGKMNKVARIDKILQKHLHYKCSFTAWRAKRHPQFIIKEINQVATVDYPNRLYLMAEEYQRKLLPKPAPMPQQVSDEKVILRRERKNDPLIAPIDDPQIITYEGLLLTIIHGYFIHKQCHIAYEKFRKIEGGGTLFRPQNCTRTRFSTIIAGFHSVANILSSIDIHIEEQRERMDQLYYINQNYLNVTEVAKRYISGGWHPHIYFKRAGKYTPAYYNENYPQIMQVITKTIPDMIRECAAYLAMVYQIDNGE